MKLFNLTESEIFLASINDHETNQFSNQGASSSRALKQEMSESEIFENKLKMSHIVEEQKSVSDLNKLECQDIWNKLQAIAENFLHEQSEKSAKTELNDILMIITDDPDRMTYFKNDYGEKKVEAIIKATTKILHPDDRFDKCLAEFLWNKRDDIIRFSSFQKNLRSKEWDHINRVVTLLFECSEAHVPHFSRFSKNILFKKYTLLVLMATYPEAVRNESISDDIGSVKLEIGISQCKHILERVMARKDTDASQIFEAQRDKYISKFGRETLKTVVVNYNDIYNRICMVLKKYLIECLTILLFTKPTIMRSNYMKYTLKAETASESIIDEIQKCVNKCIFQDYGNEDDDKEAVILLKKETVDEGMSIPIIASITSSEAGRSPNKQKLKLHLKTVLTAKPHLSILEFEYEKNDDVINVVCIDTTTFNWLKAETMALRMQISSAKNLRSVILANELKTILMFTSVRLNKPFETYMKMIKKYNPKLQTQLWKPSKMGSHGWKMAIEVDVESLIELEVNKRTISAGEIKFTFNIKYLPMATS